MNNNTFDYFQPTEILFGEGRLKEAGEATRRFGRRCLLVTVPEIPVFKELYRTITMVLKEAGLDVFHFDGVVPNPTVESVRRGAAMARENTVDVVLGLGGGSSMDTAKAIAVEATHTGSCWDYLFFKDCQPTEKTLPIVAVTTTSGTGSHITQVAVVTNPEERCKSALFHNQLFPNISIVDPDLMHTIPPDITAVTGFDVFAHAFESFINPGGSPYTDLMAREAIRLVVEYLPQAVRNGDSPEARRQMAWADTLAGLCIANAGVTLPHGIGMAIGGLYPHVAHGEALAVVYPAILRYTWSSAPEKFAAVSRIFNPELIEADRKEAAEQLSVVLEIFLERIGLQPTLKALKIPEEELRRLAQASLVLPDYKSHPKVACLTDVESILTESYD